MPQSLPDNSGAAGAVDLFFIEGTYFFRKMKSFFGTYQSCCHAIARCLILAMLCLPICPDNALSQNNPFKIDDRLYPLYMHASSTRSIAAADTLFREAAKLGDKKAQCLTLVVPVRYYYEHSNDSLPMAQAVKRLQDFSKKANFEQYYYYGSVNFVNFLIRKARLSAALEYAQEMYREATATGSVYGVFNSQKAIANIHFARNEYRQARKLYLEAVDYAQKHLGKEDEVFLYFRIASCYLNQEDYENTKKYAIIVINNSKVPHTVLRAQYVLAMAYFYSGERDKFLSLYKEVDKKYSKYDNDSATSSIWGLKVMNYIMLEEYDKAVKQAKLHPSKKERIYFLAMSYERMGDYLNALKFWKMHHHFNDSVSNLFSSQMLAQQAVSTTRFILSEEQRQIELDNINLELDNSKLAIEDSRNEAENERLNAENLQLELDNNTLEATRMKLQIMIQEAEQQKAKEAASNQHELFLHAMLIGLELVILLVFIIFASIKVSKRLKSTNVTLQSRQKNLDEARREAVQADQMKTQFLQNMSHEVRTPLNAIVGFSQLIAENADELEPEERADFSRRIEKNSDLVLNIINDILDMTSIESGHYQMRHDTAMINNLCRTAMANAKADTADGVELKFTTDIADDFGTASDSRRIAQILRNLLSNAQKNTTAGHIHLDCSAAARHGYITISVTDTGIGIEPDKSELIFERFYKVDDLKQGAGLGLSVCRSIADMLNAQLYLDTTYSGGARFVLEIPVTPAASSTT